MFLAGFYKKWKEGKIAYERKCNGYNAFFNLSFLKIGKEKQAKKVGSFYKCHFLCARFSAFCLKLCRH